MNRRDLQRLARTRLAEARVLLAAKEYDGAYYLAGYAIECALKSCVARKVKKFDFPDKKRVVGSHTHDLEQLLSVSDLQQAHEHEMKTSAEFRAKWLIVREWSENARYATGRSETQARDLYSAITDRRNGILTWLKKYW